MSTVETQARPVGRIATVGRNAAILAAGTLFAKFGSLAVQPFILRAFTPAQYGEFAAAFAYAGLLGMVAYFGMNPVVIRDISRGERSRGDAVFHCTALRAMLLVVAAGALAVVGWFARFDSAMWALAWLAFAAMAFDAVTGAVKAAMQAEGRFGRMAMVDLVRKSSQWVLALAVVAAGTGILTLGVSVTVAAAAAMACAISIGVKREDFAGVRIAPSYALQMLKFAAPMGLSAAFLLALERVDIWMLDAFRGKQDVAVYQAGVLFKPDFIAQSVVWAILPLAFRLGKDNLGGLTSAVRTTGRYLLVIAAALSIVFVAGGGLLVPLLAGQQYLSSVNVFRIMGLALPLGFLSFLYLHALTAVDRQIIAAVIFALGFAANTLIDLWLVPSMGPTGAILGTLTAETLIAGCSFACVWKFVGRPFEGADVRAAAAVLTAACSATACGWLGMNDLGAISVCVLAFALWAFKAFNREQVARFAATLAGR